MTEMNHRTDSIEKESFADWERETIEIFLLAANAFNLPRSIGEIYGVYFVSEEPLSLNEVTSRLGISKGSASQGLRFLRNIGAIKPVHRPGFRRDCYQPELELRVLLGGLLRERILPYLDQGNEKLKTLKKLNHPQTDNRKHLDSRITKLQSWHSQAGTFLPLLSRFLG